MKSVVVSFFVFLAYAGASDSIAIPRSCDVLWSSAVQTLIHFGFEVRSSDKAGGVISLGWRKGASTYGSADLDVRSLTRASYGALTTFSQMELRSATATLASVESHRCKVALSVEFVAWKNSLFQTGWVAIESNGTLEARALEQVAEVAKSLPDSQPDVPALPTRQIVDPRGWDRAKWGMNKDQVVQAYAGRATRLLVAGEPDADRYGLPGLMLLGKPFAVEFSFNPDSAKLKRVVLRRDGISSSKETAECYTGLYDLLNEKYGQSTTKPSAQDHVEGQSIASESTWVLPETTIVLSNWRGEGGGGSCTIIYTPRISPDADKL